MQNRRLAAIMFSDIVGYNSLLNKNESKAFDALNKSRRIHRKLIKKYNGRWLKEMEGGFLASFSSNMDAVMCAISIHRAAEELDILVRIGIHQGDVIFERNDALGDGVNIASRIRGKTEKNEIVISDTVFKDIKNKEGLDIEFLGEQVLKGVSNPTGIYKVVLKDESLLDFSIDTGELVQPFGYKRTTIIFGILIIAALAYTVYFFLPKFSQSTSDFGNSVLILPFNNYLGTDTLDYFVAGMHDALIGDIGKISALHVKSKTTSNAYRNMDKSIPEIADELGVNTFVEAAVLCMGDSVCLRVRLFDEHENEIWIQDFKAEKSQILNMYATVTKGISGQIGALLTPEEEQQLAKSRIVDLEVYDTYLKSHEYWDDFSLESLNKGKEYLNRAIERDPDWAPLYAGLAKVWMGINQMGFESPEIAIPKIYENINKALELDPDHADAHFLNAMMTYLVEWDWKKGEKEFLKAIAINPNDAYSRIYYAQLLYILHRSDEAEIQARLAYELDPLNPIILVTYAFALQCAGDYDNALIHAEKAFSIDPGGFLANNGVQGAAFYCKQYDRLIEADILALKIFFGDQIDEETYKEIGQIYEERGYFAAYERILTFYEELYINGFLNPGVMAILYITGNQQEKAMDCLEKGYELHDPQMPYIASGGYPFDSLFNNPRFIAILDKMNLPHPIH